jgi:hypothetical protein
MPVEIRELVIKAIVEQKDMGSTYTGTNSSSPDNAVSSQEETIKLCVEKVLEILKDRDER